MINLGEITNYIRFDDLISALMLYTFARFLSKAEPGPKKSAKDFWDSPLGVALLSILAVVAGRAAAHFFGPPFRWFVGLCLLWMLSRKIFENRLHITKYVFERDGLRKTFEEKKLFVLAVSPLFLFAVFLMAWYKHLN